MLVLALNKRSQGKETGQTKSNTQLLVVQRQDSWWKSQFFPFVLLCADTDRLEQNLKIYRMAQNLWTSESNGYHQNPRMVPVPFCRHNHQGPKGRRRRWWWLWSLMIIGLKRKTTATKNRATNQRATDKWMSPESWDRAQQTTSSTVLVWWNENDYL